LLARGLRAPVAAPIIAAIKPNKEPNTNPHNPERILAAVSRACWALMVAWGTLTPPYNFL